MNDLHIPYAKDGNNFVVPNIANKNTIYTCPECDEVVLLASGSIVRPYFRHFATNELCKSTRNETYQHLKGKLVLANILKMSLTNPNYDLLINTYCDICEGDHNVKIEIYGKSFEVRTEYTYGDYRGDVVLIKPGIDGEPDSIIMWLEIFVVNKVTPEKAQGLDAMDIHWLEIIPSHIEEIQDGANIKPIKTSSKLDETLIEKCKRKRQAKIDTVKEKYPESIYRLKELRYELDESSGDYMIDFPNVGGHIYVNFDEVEVRTIKRMNSSKVRNPNCSIKYTFGSSPYFRRAKSESILAHRINELQELGFTVVVDFANSYSYVPLSKTGVFDTLKRINNQKKRQPNLKKFTW